MIFINKSKSSFYTIYNVQAVRFNLQLLLILSLISSCQDNSDMIFIIWYSIMFLRIFLYSRRALNMGVAWDSRPGADMT